MTIKNVLLLITPASPGRFAGIARYAKEHGWHLTVADRLTHALTGWTGDGALVTLRDDATVLRQVRALRRRGIPVVDLTITRPEIRLPRVAGDNAAIGRVAAAHFLARYFRHAAWFSTSWGHQHRLRRDAFARAFTAAGRPAPASWIWSLDPKSTQTDDWRALSRWLMKRLRDAPRPLGVFCFDDADASRVESVALAGALRIPEDVAILGTGDDEPLCEAQTVPISSVRHDLSENGYHGAALLDALMAGGDGAVRPDARLIPPLGIRERASTDALAVDTPLVRRAVAIYRDDLARPPSTEQLADRLGVSRASLDRAFAADLGLAPAHLLARLRLDAARRLLRTTGRSVSEIAYALGYCNPAYFSNVFRAATGASPKAWRSARHETRAERPAIDAKDDASAECGNSQTTNLSRPHRHGARRSSVSPGD